MAATLCRVAGSIFRRSVIRTTVRASSDHHGPAKDQHELKKDANVGMPDPIGHSIGHQRDELFDKFAGFEDPFDITVSEPYKQGLEFEKPINVYSLYGERFVGCLCEEDSNHIVWMQLLKGQTRRCKCGFWFKLQDINEFTLEQYEEMNREELPPVVNEESAEVKAA